MHRLRRRQNAKYFFFILYVIYEMTLVSKGLKAMQSHIILHKIRQNIATPSHLQYSFALQRNIWYICQRCSNSKGTKHKQNCVSNRNTVQSVQSMVNWYIFDIFPQKLKYESQPMKISYTLLLFGTSAMENTVCQG